MDNREQYLHLWAIVPPSDVAQQIDKLRKEFSARFQCFKGLKPPVHLTLYAPYRATSKEVTAQIEWFRSLIAKRPSFSLVLKNFSFFEHGKNPVLFVDVLRSRQLTALNADITLNTIELFALPNLVIQRFHPHFTIGYRDIPRSIFPQIKEEYSQRLFKAEFKADHVCLFRHNGTNWELEHEFPLWGGTTPQTAGKA